MEFTDKKSAVLYKNESGGRIMVRVTLPKADDADFNDFYSALAEAYFLASKNFINGKKCDQSYFADVTYGCENFEKYIKIKRFFTLRPCGAVLRAYSDFDIFTKNGLKLKK